MSWSESDFVTQADINIYEERITLNQKMRTKLTLEQKRWILDIIGGFNHYLKTTAQNFYRYDVFQDLYDTVTRKIFTTKWSE